MPIQVLPGHVVSRIRAGEVIERPAAAVKELMENSADAGATEVKVSIASGGRKCLSVEDNGCGMPMEDLELAAERHATSKLDGRFDLGEIRTYGFRGEALAALASVSTLSIATRPLHSDCGWRLTSGPSGTRTFEPCARPAGSTLVTAADLFGSHPARAAFLKSDRAELAAVRATVETAALANPSIAYSLLADNRQILAFKAASWEERAAAVMGMTFMQNSLAFHKSGDGCRVRGIVGLPAWRGHASAGQRFYVNQRPVQDRVLASAVRSAFADVSGERSPAIILDVSVEPGLLDVNVHPAKEAVRFRQAEAIQAFIKETVRDALAGTAPIGAPALAAAAALAAVPLSIGDAGVRERLPLGRAMGLAAGGYTVSASMDGIIVIDTHAASERMAYERLMAQAVTNGIPSRRLRSPIVVDVGAVGTALIEQRLHGLKALGLDVDILDDVSVTVLAVPSFVLEAEARQLILDVAASLLDDPFSSPVEGLLSKVCSSLSCHAAFRFGDEATLEELDTLLRSFESTPRIGTCMHGRPTFTSLTRQSLETLFRRH
jgi:DNA mismatch repair protein MutL